MFVTNLSSSITPGLYLSIRPSARAIARVMALASVCWGVASIPMNTVQAAQLLSTTARTEESEKCEWLGVCDASELSNHVARTEESDQCTWLGICD
jgi:hypothetical protein